VSGDPDEVVTRLRALLDAGADAIGLFPVPPERVASLVALTAREVLPRI
jgi:hypothetical protein